MAGGKRRIDPAEFRRLVDEAKEKHNISDVAAIDRKIVKAGREFVALCAFHNERSPSMRLNDLKGTYHCFGCGATGDIVKYVRETQRIGFMDAMRFLDMAELPAVDPAARAKAAAEDEAGRLASIAEAQAVWDRAVPAAGTLAEIYARTRGIIMPLPPSIRFVRVHVWSDPDTGETGRDYPAMVGAVTVPGGDVIGLQRIFLRDDGTDKRWKKPKNSKLSMGRIKGGALRLDDSDANCGETQVPQNAASEIIITEGPEDGMSLAQELPDRRVWVGLGTSMLPDIDYDDDIRSIAIAGQNDDAGRAAVEKAALKLVERGFVVRTMFPDPAFKDWNDQLRGIRK